MNVTKVILMVLEGDTLSIVTTGDEVWMPFGENSTHKKIRSRFAPMFDERDTIFFSPVTKANINGTALLSPLSIIMFEKLTPAEMVSEDDAEHQDEIKNPIKLHYALIEDAIPVAYGLEVGMTKVNFLTKLFGRFDAALLTRVNVVDVGDPRGEEFDIFFHFEDEILKQIKVLSVF
ncbi:MAG: hypothetical protein ABWZ25_15200 [Chitinophagaceae bacterium]